MTTIINVEVDEKTLKALVISYLEQTLAVGLDLKELAFEVRSKQNYRSKEWELGEMRVRITKRLSLKG